MQLYVHGAAGERVAFDPNLVICAAEFTATPTPKHSRKACVIKLLGGVELVVWDDERSVIDGINEARLLGIFDRNQ